MLLLEMVGFIKRVKNREKIFTILDKPLMPSEITKKIYGKFSNTYFNIVSRSLSELKDKGLIEVINPNEKTGRIYQKTQLGKQVERKLNLLKK